MSGLDRVLGEKFVIEFRKRVLLISLTCSKCAGLIASLPREAADDRWYLKNRQLWLELGKRKPRKQMCPACELIASRANGGNRRKRECAAPGKFTVGDVLVKMEAQGGLCVYCHADVTGGEYHVDHVVPLVRGGSNDASNIQVTCPRCNLSKGARTHDEFVEYLLTKGNRCR